MYGVNYLKQKVEVLKIDGEEDVTLMIREGTPDSVSDNLPKEYLIDDLRITMCDDEEYGPQAWDPYFPVMHYNVARISDGARIGDLDIDYDYKSKTINIDVVGIEDEERGKGYGVELYSAVMDIMMPDGTMPREAGFSFITEDHSMEAERVWRALEKRGLAANMGGRAYMWVGQ